ncbi:MAG: acyl carrier protein [Paracoccaceae bacterium]|jgi:acyl carrier protein
MNPVLKDKIIAILAEQAVLNVEDIRIDATLDELGIDSLGLVETVFAIEETFDVEVPFNANGTASLGDGPSNFDISTVSAIIRGVERLVAAK